MTLSVETRIYEGKSMIKPELDKVLRVVGVNSRVIQQHGALCLNVESGREIAGVAEYHPSKIIATEPDDGTQRAKVCLEELSKLAHRFKASVRVEDDYTALTELAKQKQHFGLITNLNIFPDQIPGIGRFFVQARELTAPNGVIVGSVAEEEYGSYLHEIEQQGIVGLKLSVHEKNLGVAGSVFLLAKKE